MRALLALAAVALLAGGATGCGGNDDAGWRPTGFDMEGFVHVAGQGTSEGQPCQPGGAYSDLGIGTQVTIYNAAGEPIKLTSIGRSETQGRDCVLVFSAARVPIEGKDAIYSVEVAHRGKVNFTQQQGQIGGLDLTIR